MVVVFHLIMLLYDVLNGLELLSDLGRAILVFFFLIMRENVVSL